MTQSPLPTEPGRPDTYLVVMREVLIAQDLCLTICEFDPAARVILARDMNDALAKLGETLSLAVAFVEERPAPFARSGLSGAIAQRGGRVVLLGEQAEAHGPTSDWDVLHKPFATNHVLSILSSPGSGGGSWLPELNI